MLRTWLEPEQNSVPEGFIAAIGGNPLVSHVLYSRGLQDLIAAKGFLQPEDYHPTPASALPNLGSAVELIQSAISSKKTIGIWGDFDVDGQTSTTILVSSLRQMGASVIYHIPVRAEESHGISLPALSKFLQQDIGLMVTCDTGISSHEAIEYARSNSVPVVVTDHHDLPEVLPPADAIINPKMLPEFHPLSSLPGAGVAYKLIEELCHALGRDEIPSKSLDLVALGIVADIALLRGDTRYLLQQGLKALRQTHRAGLLAMFELAELNQANITEEHISFILAPRMNALGRLDDANSMVELLTTTDKGRARVLAVQLEGMNAQRKLLSDQVYQAAQAQISTDPTLLNFPVLVLSHPSWPTGVVGIVASRLVEQYHRPTILLSAPSGGEARGSGRSIEAINITKAIAANQNLVRGFGGHPMAAGLAIDSELIPEFRQAISRTVQSMGINVPAEKELQIDGYLSLPEITLDLVEDLERLAPFGAGNPPLVFASRSLKLTGYAAVGRASEHLQLSVEDELGHIHRSIWWQGAGYTLPETDFDLAYSVRASTYRGQREIQIEWIDYRPVDNGVISLRVKKEVSVIDLRTEPKPLSRLNQLLKEQSILVWGEAEAKSEITCLDRFALSPAESLAIWTVPPGPTELQTAIETVKPARVFLFATLPGMDEPHRFLNRLSGLIKAIIRRSGGTTSLNFLASATSQRIETVKTGLEWLEANGYIHLMSIQNVAVSVEPGDESKTEKATAITRRLTSQLAESAAYRRYYLSAKQDRLLHFDEEG